MTRRGNSRMPWAGRSTALRAGPSTLLGAGFTLVELACVLAISAIVVPGAFLLLRVFESGHHAALAKVAAATAARTVSERIRLDLRTRRWADPPATALVGEGACGALEYAVKDGVLWRRASADCGGEQALCRGAARLEREAGGLALVLRRETGPGMAATDRFLLPLPGAAAPPVRTEASLPLGDQP